MRVTGVRKHDIRRILDSINKDFDTSLYAREMMAWETQLKTMSGQVLRTQSHCKFQLRLYDSADVFHRLAYDGRSKVYVCWHGTTLFLARLFKQYPTAKVHTDFIRYADAQEFYQRFKQTAIGVPLGRDVRSYENRCECNSCDTVKSLNTAHASQLMREIFVETRQAQEEPQST